MVATTEWSKSDPKDAVIVDLTTIVHNLEDARSPGGGGYPEKTTTTSLSGQGISEDVPGYPGLAKWLIFKGEGKSLGMERPIGGVPITSEIIFMMGCTWSMILEIDKKHGRQSLKEKRLAGITMILILPSHHRVIMTSVNSNYPTNFSLQ